MAKKVHTYEGQEVRVTYDARRCIHAGECVRGLPSVFDPKNTPWVAVDGADRDALVEVVGRCPTGALHVETHDGERLDRGPMENTVTIAADGPLFAQGDLEIVDGDQNVVLRDSRVALCRCGASQNKPFCDGAHSGAGFEAGDGIPDPKIRDTGAEGPGLQIVVAANGPLILNGPVTVAATEGDDRCSGDKTALCRCGASQNKPFCDGTHAKVGFTG